MTTDAQHLKAVRYLRAYLDPNAPVPERPEGLDHLIAAVEEELAAHDSDDQLAALRFVEAEMAGLEPERRAWRAVEPHVYPLPRHIRRALELASLRAKVEGLEEQLAEERQRAEEHAREAKAWCEDAKFWMDCERGTARWAAKQPTADSTTLLLRSFAEPESPEGKRREQVIQAWLEDGAPNYRHAEEVEAEVAALPREDRLQAEVQRLREQVRTVGRDVSRRPIETLPEEREGDVLIFCYPRPRPPRCAEVLILPPDAVSDREALIGYGYTHWSFFPPLAPEPTGLTVAAIAEFLGFGLAEGWCKDCETDLRGDEHGGPIRQSKSYDSPYREWACPECGHTEDDPELTLDDLRDVMVDGWKMPESPGEGWEPIAWWADGCLRLAWRAPDGRRVVRLSHPLRSPFREGVEITAKMLTLVGFVVEESR